MRTCIFRFVFGLLAMIPLAVPAQYDTMHFVSAPFNYLTWEKAPGGIIPLMRGGYMVYERVFFSNPGMMYMSWHDSVGTVLHYDSIYTDTAWVFPNYSQIGIQSTNSELLVWGWQEDTCLCMASGFIRRMGEDGSLRWHREYLPEDTLMGIISRVIELPGGYLLATGQAGDSLSDPSPDGWVLMTDSLGNRMWELFYDGVDNGGICDVLYDGNGHAYAFYFEATGPFDHYYGTRPADLTIFKINVVTGMFEEIIPVNLADDYDQPFFFNWDYDSSRFIGTGTHYPLAAFPAHKPRPFMLAVDTTGVIDWEYREPYNGIFSSFIFSTRAVIRQPGRYVVSGDCQSLTPGPSYGVTMRTMCIDSTGSPYWESYFNVPSSPGCTMDNRPDWPGGFAPTADGGYVAAVRVIMSCESCLPGQPPLWMIPNQTTTVLVKMDSVGCYTTYCGSMPTDLSTTPGAYFSAPYPNPASERFSLSTPPFAVGHYGIRVRDLTSGKVLFEVETELTGTTREYSVPVSGIPAGVYLVQQELDGEPVRTDKVVITP